MFIVPVRIYYEDTDGSGVVYHANYLHYFERARTEWLRDLGFSQQALNETAGVAFTVSRLNINYLRPARLDDALLVSTEVVECRRASLSFSQNLRRDGESNDLARAQVRVACVNAKTFRPCGLPQALYQQLIQ